MIVELNLEQEIFQDLIIKLCTCSKYEFFNKDQIIYKIEDHADRFYVITKGECFIQKAKKKIKKMTKLEYVNHLKNIHMLNDKFFFKKHVNSNRKLININEYEIQRIIDKHKRTIAIQKEYEKKQYNMLFLEGIYKKTFEEYINEINEKIIPSKFKLEDYKSKLYEFYDETESDKFQDEIIFDENKYEFLIFEYKTSNILKEGNYFGENGDSPMIRIRSQYLIAGKDCECFSISNDLYKQNILNEYIKMRNKEISFLNDNYIFSNIKKGTFLNIYFKYFKKEVYNRGEILFYEMDEVDRVYFIKEGRLELSLFSNIIKLHDYIEQLKYCISELKDHLGNNEKLPKLQCSPTQYIDLLKKNKINNLFIFSNNDIVGIEETRFDFKRLYRATVISDKISIYSLPVVKLRKMVEFEKIKDEYLRYSLLKLSNFVNRISLIRDGSIKHIDKSFKDINDILEIQNSKKKIYTLSVKHTVCCLKNNNKNNNKSPNEDKNLNNYDDLTSDKKEQNQLENLTENKNKIKKDHNEKIKNQVEAVNEMVNIYYKNNKNWKKHNKRMNLEYQPQGDVFKFYQYCNFEKNKIAELKSDIIHLKTNSLQNYLPRIIPDTQRIKSISNSILLEKTLESSKIKIDNSIKMKQTILLNQKPDEKNYIKKTNEGLENNNNALKSCIETLINDKEIPQMKLSLNLTKKTNSDFFITDTIYFNDKLPNFGINEKKRSLVTIIKPSKINFESRRKKSYNKSNNESIEKNKLSNYSMNIDGRHSSKKSRNLNNSIKSKILYNSSYKIKNYMDTDKIENISIIDLNNTIKDEEVESEITKDASKMKRTDENIDYISQFTSNEGAINEKIINCFHSTNDYLFQSNELKSIKLKRINNLYSNSIDKSKSKSNYKNNEDIKRKEESFINDKNKSRFVPFSVDNSMVAIKNLHKKILSLAPKKKYNNNFLI
jgi:CRP-like cAMP-binding protein